MTSECDWHEPFVLYYDEKCDGDKYSIDESLLKFTIQMGYDDIESKRGEKNRIKNLVRKDTTEITEYLVGEHESFHLNQFSEGEIYLKEIKFGLR